jgi:hypothetical protein
MRLLTANSLAMLAVAGAAVSTQAAERRKAGEVPAPRWNGQCRCGVIPARGDTCRKCRKKSPVPEVGGALGGRSALRGRVQADGRASLR